MRNRIRKNRLWILTAIETFFIGYYLEVSPNVDSHINSLFNHISDDWFDYLLMAVSLFTLAVFIFKSKRLLELIAMSLLNFCWAYIAANFFAVYKDPSNPHVAVPAVLTIISAFLVLRMLWEAWLSSPEQEKEKTLHE